MCLILIIQIVFLQVNEKLTLANSYAKLRNDKMYTAMFKFNCRKYISSTFTLKFLSRAKLSINEMIYIAVFVY
jgi:hypothetical protein